MKNINMEEGRFKFVSKSQRLSVVLDRAIREDKFSGRPALPGFQIKFLNGTVTVQEETAARMRSHKGFGQDYYEVMEEGVDIYANRRTSNEPGHMITEMQYGHPGKSMNTPLSPKFSESQLEEVRKVAKEMAIQMTREMAPEMARAMLKNMLAEQGNTLKEETSSPSPSTGDSQSPLFSNPIPGSEEVTPLDEYPELVTPEDSPFLCPGCNKVSKNAAGNAAHQRHCAEVHKI